MLLTSQPGLTSSIPVGKLYLRALDGEPGAPASSFDRRNELPSGRAELFFFFFLFPPAWQTWSDDEQAWAARKRTGP